ncbi:MAG: hypothetical protein ACREFL_03115 [Stellaceae bacterium]
MSEFDERIHQDLRSLTLNLIQNIRPDLDPVQALLLGPGVVMPMLDGWGQLERLVCAAKLAIIRDEFSVRFPSKSAETESFSFGIVDRTADRLESFLKPRKPDDIFNMTIWVIEQAFGKKPKIPGIAHFASNLTQILQAYSRTIEASFYPFAEKIGCPDDV